MAKRKTPKGDKIVDLKPKAEKVTKEQLENLQKLVTGYNRIETQIGNLEVTKHRMFNNISQVQAAISDLQAQFQKEYGSIDVSLADGTIKYNEDEQTNS
jgi:predicted  nucleic acid-binding Zn-ribbon protein